MKISQTRVTAHSLLRKCLKSWDTWRRLKLLLPLTGRTFKSRYYHHRRPGKMVFAFSTRQQKSPPCTSTFSWWCMYSSHRFLMLLHTMLRHYINMIPVKSWFFSILRLPWNIKLAWPFKCGLFFSSSPAGLPGFQSPGYSPTWSQNILNDILPWRTHKNNKTLRKFQSFMSTYTAIYVPAHSRYEWLFTTAPCSKE